MEKFKKILSILLVFAVLIGSLPLNLMQADAATTNETFMSIKYDDHLDISGKTVQIIDAGTPTSYKVGYGIEENVLDTAVVTIEGDNLVATGIGTALVTIDGTPHQITVEAAPISMLFLIGQSNMEGMEGNQNQSILCEEGQVYSTYGDRYNLTESTARNYAASALTGEYRTINVNGTTDKLSGHPIYALTEDGNGKIGSDSGIAYEWAKQTGEKVWVINAAHGGTSINTWVEGGTNYKEAVALFKACLETMQKEIAAGHYTLSHMGYFWCQGCADETMSAEWYVNKYLSMHDSFKKALSFDHDSNEATDEVTLEFGGIIPIRSGHQGSGSYRAGTYDVTTTAPYFESFLDLRMNGPRVAQYWMGNNPELTDIWNVCTIQEKWATMPDGTSGVAEYFQTQYVDGKVDYETQVKQSASWYKPTTPAAVHDSIHYNQIGYNEIGRESARNALINLGEIPAPEADPVVEFVTWDGFSEAQNITASPLGSSETLVVPMVTPVYMSKQVTYETSKGLDYKYYDLMADSIFETGTLKAVGAQGETVSVTPRDLTSYRWTFDGSNLVSDTSCGDSSNPLIKISGSISSGIFNNLKYQLTQPVVLMHDETWVIEWTLDSVDGDTIGSMILSGDQDPAAGSPYVYVRPLNGFVGMGIRNGSNYDNYGYYMSDFNIDMTDGSHTYRLVNRIYDDGSNMVYLFVDGEEIGPLDKKYLGSTTYVGTSQWISGQDFAFSYMGANSFAMAGYVLEYMTVSEKSIDEDTHFHSYSQWVETKVPTADSLGEEERVCEGCGNVQTRDIEGSWQLYDLASHFMQIPDNASKKTNLWNILDHDEYYFGPNKTWITHESGTVYSVTIPVNEGDKIYASSFGAAGKNGSTANGIRVTYFDDYGVVKTMAPTETYAQFSQNGYLIVPEGAKYMNIPMWTNSDQWEIYNLSLVADLSDLEAELEYESIVYDGSAKTPAVSIEGLIEGEDYNVEYSPNKNVGTVTVTITGKDAYKGTIIKTFEILPATLNVISKPYIGDYNGQECSISVEAPEGAVVTYATSEAGPYTTEKPSFVNVGEYIVYYKVEKENYTTVTGSQKVTINYKIINNMEATLEYQQVTYDGTAKEPKVSVEGLTEKDYFVFYSSNEKVGTATVIISGCGNYVGTIIKTFEITAKLQNNPFIDVQEGRFYYTPVLWAVEKGITAGVTPTEFRPDAKCTRAQVVTFLWNAAGKPDPLSTNTQFTDLRSGAYYEKAVLWATENGIAAGITATQFKPDDTVTRAQFVTFLWRMMGKPEPTCQNPFTDLPEDKYYTKAVLWAYESGVTAGMTPTTFQPDSTCTRGQVVSFIYRALN